MGINPFEVARATGNQFARGRREASESQALDEILTKAMSSKNEDELNKSIGSLLSQVSPQKQGMAYQLIQNRMNTIQKNREKEKSDRAIRSIGIDPDLPPALQKEQIKQQQKGSNRKLDQELNQHEKRYKAKIGNLKLPFEKRDAFGNVVLDFAEDEVNKSKVLTQLNKELENYYQDIAKTYQKFGEDPPDDVIDAIKESVKIKQDGQEITLKVADQIKKFTEQFDPEKHKGRSGINENGIKLYSDGKKWIVRGQ